MLSLPTHQAKVLVVGGGGREHALVWKLAQSALVGQVFCAPGNGGTACEHKTTNIDIKMDDFTGLTKFCLDEQIDLTVVGPDNALAAGIVDYFQEKGLRIFGPTKAAAKLEWSKSYAKQFMAKYNIPTAKFSTCSNYGQACELLDKAVEIPVIKVDGLALGKGVYVCNDKNEAKQALKEIFEEEKFAQAGEIVIFEEKLSGEEISLFLLADGNNFLPLAASQDYKRRFDGDYGPNTGGMGAISPPAVYATYEAEVERIIIGPLKQALKKEGINYQGLLYIGLILDQEKGTGKIRPKILEFNARFGDPETEAVLPRLESDLFPALWACTEGKLDEIQLSWIKNVSACVVAVNKDYPEESSSGKPITLPASMDKSIVVFHAGTKIVDKTPVTGGGRILAVSALGTDLDKAATMVYKYLSGVSFDCIDYRKDIARIPSRTHS